MPTYEKKPKNKGNTPLIEVVKGWRISECTTAKRTKKDNSNMSACNLRLSRYFTYIKIEIGTIRNILIGL